MLRLLLVLMAPLCIAVLCVGVPRINVLWIGIVALVGMPTAQPVGIDIGVLALPSMPGFPLLVVLLAGALVGGSIVTTSVVLPLLRMLRASRFDGMTVAKMGT